MTLELTSWAGWSAALLAGLVGGVAHCPLMCGGLALAGARVSQETGQRHWRLLLLHGGRITTYLALALLLAGFGDAIAGANVQALRQAWQFILGLTLLLLAFDLIGKGRWAGKLSAKIGPVVHRAMQRARQAGMPASFGAGMAWGAIPCMLSWPAIITAATLPLWQAAVAIAIFGLATAVPLLAFQGLDRFLGSRSQLRWQQVSHAAIAAYGLLLVVQATNLFNPHVSHQSSDQPSAEQSQALQDHSRHQH